MISSEQRIEENSAGNSIPRITTEFPKNGPVFANRRRLSDLLPFAYHNYANSRTVSCLFLSAVFSSIFCQSFPNQSFTASLAQPIPQPRVLNT